MWGQIWAINNLLSFDTMCAIVNLKTIKVAYKRQVIIYHQAKVLEIKRRYRLVKLNDRLNGDLQIGTLFCG